MGHASASGFEVVEILISCTVQSTLLHVFLIDQLGGMWQEVSYIITTAECSLTMGHGSAIVATKYKEFVYLGI